jgi:hypothetical protein
VTADNGASTTTMITDMLDLGIRMGRDVLSALRSDRPATSSLDVLRSGVASLPLSGLMPSMQTCCCAIPPPCWMPRDLGRVVSHGCPGAKAQLRLRVTNDGLGARTITADATGAGASMVTLDPASLVLGTFEQGTVTATVTIPDQGGSAVETLVWIHGCRDHVVRWCIEVSDAGCSSLHEVDVSDCPDLIHHWYDHFYCARPCSNSQDPASHG